VYDDIETAQVLCLEYQAMCEVKLQVKLQVAEGYRLNSLKRL